IWNARVFRLPTAGKKLSAGKSLGQQVIGMKKIQMIAVLIVILSIAMAAMAYLALPDTVASHWGVSGRPNGYSSKLFAVAIFPALSVLILAIYYILPKIDPKMKAYGGFEREYGQLFIAILAFLQYIFALTILFNAGVRLNIIQWLAPAFAVLFYFAGKAMLASKQNYFVGFRTPWTLASATVWEKTNRLAGSMLMAAAAIALIGIVLPSIGLFGAIGIAIATAIVGCAYSYVEYQAEAKRASRQPGKKAKSGRKK
ncbi:MAG TPA: SdpI family protein, partial [Candidatus Micrarchaeota archaeon]|nr:SdpI family protein [Candidatus Micrarchaeota archaeon]